MNQGFDRFFGYNCQAVAHNFYPVSLWNDEAVYPLNNPKFSAQQKLPATADPNDAASYRPYRGNDYSADVIHSMALKFLRENAQRPFFLFVPSTIPHVSLQVPDEALKEYIGKLDDEPYKGERRYLPHPFPHACYAAMVSRLDQQVGEIVAELEKQKIRDNTIIVFASDNGPAADRVGGSDSDYFNSAGGLSGKKGSLQDGGVRSPGIVNWPGRVPAGSLSARLSGFEDWIPTLFDLAGLKLDDPGDLDGISLAPTLLGKDQPERPFLYREFVRQQAVWSGPWKAIRNHLDDVKDPQSKRTELYNLESDPTESKDLAAAHPDTLQRLEAILDREHRPSELFPIPTLDAK